MPLELNPSPTTIVRTPKRTSIGVIAFAPEAIRRGDRWRTPVCFAAVALFLLGFFRLLWQSALAQLRLRRTESITGGPLRTALDQLLAHGDIRHPVRLAQSRAATEPAAGGILRWTIIVPPAIDHRLTPPELHALLAHELAHLVRRDPLWLWIAAALCSCLPIQPFNFLAVRRWRHAAEELCDDWAVAGGVRPLTLAHCLTRVAEWRLSPMPLGLTSDVGKSRFARRISRLVSGAPHDDRWSCPARRRVLLTASAGCLALLTVCGPRIHAGSPSATSQPLAIQEMFGAEVPAIVGAAPPGAAGTGLSAAKEAPVDSPSTAVEPVEPNIERSSMSFSLPDGSGGRPDEGPVSNAGVEADLAPLLNDLERVQALIGQLESNPELEAARMRLHERLNSLRKQVIHKP